jgi:hypothetical protein
MVGIGSHGNGGKFYRTKLLQFRLKGNSAKMRLASVCPSHSSTWIVTKESTHLEVGILGMALRLDEQYGA